MTSHSQSSSASRHKRLEAIKAAVRKESGAAARAIERSADRSRFPLSTGQQRLWFLEQAVPGSLVYQVPAVVHLQGPLDARALEVAIRRLVERHEVLRARFTLANGVPTCEIAEHLDLKLDRDSVAAEDSARAFELGLAAVERYVRTPFDLERGPLLRVLLLELGPEQYLLAFVLHHIICEAWSLAILFKELAAEYKEQVRGTPAQLPALPIQFGDFARWEREHLASGGGRADLDYWRAKLKHVPALELPTDRPRPAVQSQSGAIRGRPLPPATMRSVEAFAREHGVTAFVAALGALYVLLGRYSGQSDLCIGIPVSNRDQQELQDLIGFFVNTLALRTELDDGMSFVQLAERVKQTMLEAFSHQSAPFEVIVDELQVVRDLSRNPVFQVMFAFQNTPLPNLELECMRPGRVLRLDEVHSGTSKVDLSLVVEPYDSGWMLWVEYNSDLFDAARIDRLLDHYVVLLEALVADARRPIVSAPLLTEADRQRILVEWNRTERALAKGSVVARFRAQVERDPRHVAVRMANARMTYGDLDERSSRLAGCLAARGVGPGALVCVYLERSFDLVVAELAVLKVGAAYVPIDPSYPAERAAFMVGDSGCVLTITRGALRGQLPAVDVLAIDEGWGASVYVPPAGPSPGADDLAYVIYTSGSTGVPKGVEIRHCGLLNLIEWHQRAFTLGPGDVGTLVASPAFDASVWEIWPYLTAGATIAIPNDETRLAPEQLVAWMAEQQVTVSFLPTPLAEAVLPLSFPKELRLRALLTGGDVLHPLRRADLPFRVFNNYGPTENTVVTTCTEVDAAAEGAPSIGRPIDNTETYILDRNLQPVPVGVVGELCVTGIGLARGYRNRPDLTRAAFVDNPFPRSRWPRLYRTGDLCRYTADGSIRFEGRKDTQVKIRGYRVELGEIESILNAHEGIRESIVVAREDAHTRQTVLVAYFVPLAEEQGLTVNDLRKTLAAKVPQYMIPQAFVPLPALPKTANGKVDRKALPDPAARSDAVPEGQAPATEAEVLLAGIWSEVLGVAPVSANDNFFDLGGNSLLAVRVVHRLREERGVKVNPLVLFTGSLRQSAEAIAESLPSRAAVPKGFTLRRFVASVTQNINRLIEQ